MSVLAAIRPDSWNYALFMHVLGAMVLVGALVTAGTAQVLSWKPEGNALAYSRLSFRTLLIVGIPAYFVMRIGAEWIYAKEHWADAPTEPDWIGIGYVTADLGGVLLLISVILAGFGARRIARADGGSTKLARAAGVLALIVLALYLVALWAMTAKPG